jgi:hypothetical protein
MAKTQEYMVSCGTGEIPAYQPVDRPRIIPGPPPSAAPLPNAETAFRQALEHPIN